MDRSQLLHDLPAFALFFQHGLHASHLAFDPAQAFDQFGLGVLFLNFHRFTFSFLTAPGWHLSPLR
jgi:hypothetical protein